MQTIPFSADPSQSFTVSLGAASFDVEARFNDKWGAWTFDLTRSSDKVQLVSQVPIFIGQDLLGPYALQIGGLIATDLSGEGLDAGPDDLGDRVTVAWLSPDELAALVASGAAL